MQIQISWLLPTDLDLHCLQRQGISGFSRTRVNLFSMTRVKASFIIIADRILNWSFLFSEKIRFIFSCERLGISYELLTKSKEISFIFFEEFEEK